MSAERLCHRTVEEYVLFSHEKRDIMEPAFRQ